MAETIVHVTTLDQWKSVLDVWFKQGYTWIDGTREYVGRIFEAGGRFLSLCDTITFSYSITNPNSRPFIEYSDFMAQQKEANKMETYYVTQEQLDLITELKSLPSPLVAIMNKKYGIEALYNELPLNDVEWFQYLSGDNKIEFKVKEQLYRLWRIDNEGDKVYMRINSFGTPDSSVYKNKAFTAPLEEIKKHKTILWEIEEVGE